MKLDKVPRCMVLFSFLALTVHKTQKSCLLLTEELTNINVLIT